MSVCMRDLPKNYFEGVLQIRQGTPELIEWIRKRVKEDNKARIAKEKKVTGGVDLYMSDQHYLQSLGKKINEQFSGILKVSRRLHTVNKMTSKLVYRVTVLFEQLHFKRGQKVFIDEEEFEILSVDERVRLKHLKSGKKSIINVDRLRVYN